MFSTIERRNIPYINEVLRKHLQAAGDELGMKFDTGGGRYDSLQYSPKITLAVKDTSGADASIKRDWGMSCHHYEPRIPTGAFIGRNETIEPMPSPSVPSACSFAVFTASVKKPAMMGENAGEVRGRLKSW